jgi:ABC-type Fe3+/spermidine/putrescine transport system ATPase subunit
MPGSGFLHVDRVTVGYGGTPVLKDVSLSVNEGELVALLGSSGCGKTTLLRTIAGFAQPTSGAIRAAGRDITVLPPDRRDMALVFQSYALWPHMTVRENIGYGLKLRRVPAVEAAAKVNALLAMLGLDGLGDRSVTALSGGQRQRVALGRALAVDPRILLLDEPLSNLDARIRQNVRHEIRALQQRLGITAIHVTHDREEAMVMADRIVILNEGRIEQEGPPEQVYNAPATPFVARFMGAENVIDLHARPIGDGLDILPGPHNRPARLSGLPRTAWRNGAVSAYFRSEAAELVAAHTTVDHPVEDAVLLTGQVSRVSYPGGTWRHTVTLGDREVYVDAADRHDLGAEVGIRLPARTVFIFPSEGRVIDKEDWNRASASQSRERLKETAAG